MKLNGCYQKHKQFEHEINTYLLVFEPNVEDPNGVDVPPNILVCNKH